MVSHHQEGSRLHRRWENQLFGHEPRALPTFTKNHLLYLDYHQRLSHWVQIFGPDSLLVRILEPRYIKDGDAVFDFMALLGIREFTHPGRLNTSRGFIATKIGHLINHACLRNPQAVLAAIGKVPDEPQRLVPSREQAECYLSNFHESNIKLAKFLGVTGGSPFDTDLSEYPDNENDLWDEARANFMLQRILTGLEAFLEDHIADDLREAAKVVRHDNPPLAIRLLTTALRFRPNGPVIQKLLREIETASEKQPTAERNPSEPYDNA